MKFSNWGTSIRDESGITTLMKDLSCCPTSDDQTIYMLGGGAPSRIPEVEQYFHKQMQNLLDRSQEFNDLVGDYGGPQGLPQFVNSLANLLNNEYGWNLGPENIALTNGSQMAFTLLFKILAGKFPDGSHKQVLMPVSPEYIGYSDTGEERPLFHSHRPRIEELPNNMFKYRVDFNNLAVTKEIGAICISIPTNPSGNVLSNDEIQQLSDIADRHEIPLIIDSAYGLPFPGLVYKDVTPIWNENIILVLSLSKLGCPGGRTGIIIANPEVIEMVACTNAVLTLATGNFGAALVEELIETSEILPLCRDVIYPHYRKLAQQATKTVHEHFSDVPYRLHSVEGAFFLWLWFPGLPITCLELYRRLKERGVIIVPGNYFFYGLDDRDWAHANECIRVSYAQEPEIFSKGTEIIAEEVRNAYYGDQLKVVANA